MAETLKLGAERMVYHGLLPEEARPELMAFFSCYPAIPMHAQRSNDLSASARDTLLEGFLKRMSQALAIAFSEGRMFRCANDQVCQLMFACAQSRHVEMLNNNYLCDMIQHQVKRHLTTATRGAGGDGDRGGGRDDLCGAARCGSKQTRKRLDCDSSPVLERAASHESGTSHEGETSRESERWARQAIVSKEDAHTVLSR